MITTEAQTLAQQSSLSGPTDHHPWRSTAWEIHLIIKIEV
jgi:hypothetical protein